MKNQVLLVIILFFGFAFLVCLFPFDVVHAAKLESGVTINAPATTETEKICDDTIDNDNDGKIDANDQDCAPSFAEPVVEICGNGKDDNKNGKIDEVGCVLVRTSCGLQIVSGVPINYGEVNPGHDSAEQKVTIKNVGTATATVLVKGDWWLIYIYTGDPYDSPPRYVSGPGDTHVATTANLDYNNKKPLSDSGIKLGQISGGQSIPVYFQLRVPTTWTDLIEPGVTQEVSIDLIC